MDVDVDARAEPAWRVCRVRACWVCIGGARNVVVGLKCAHWGHSKHAGGRASKCAGGAEMCLPGPGFVRGWVRRDRDMLAVGLNAWVG